MNFHSLLIKACPVVVEDAENNLHSVQTACRDDPGIQGAKCSAGGSGVRDAKVRRLMDPFPGKPLIQGTYLENGGFVSLYKRIRMSAETMPASASGLPFSMRTAMNFRFSFTCNEVEQTRK